MKISKPVAIVVIIIVIAVSVAAFSLASPGSAGKYDDFAKCLAEKGVKMYGAYWCPHCTNQKNMFGSSWKYMNYVECALPNGGQADVCSSAGIQAYPTWEFSDGKVTGEMTFGDLSQKSGCTLPE